MNFELLEELSKEEFVIIAFETIACPISKKREIVELAIQQVNWNGELLNSFDSFIRPSFHENLNSEFPFNSETLKDAPSLNELKSHILSLISQRCLVAHNNSRINKYISPSLNINETAFCTQDLIKEIEPEIGFHRIDNLCKYFDIEYENKHSAIDEAKATAKLFSLLKNLHINKFGLDSFKSKLEHSEYFPLSIENYDSLSRNQLIDSLPIQTSKLQEMLSRLSSIPSKSLPINQYLNILDKALSDRIITEYEAINLIEIAQDFKLNKEQVIEIHEEYLRKLTRIYLLDNYLSDSEIDDLLKVTTLLCLTNQELNQIIDFEKVEISSPLDKSVINNLNSKTVCISGRLEAKINGNKINREKAHELISERGMVLKRVVSKKLDFLVCSHPDEISSIHRKNRKAAEYKTLIISEKQFWEMINVDID